jgi:hypothetical protein
MAKSEFGASAAPNNWIRGGKSFVRNRQEIGQIVGPAAGLQEAARVRSMTVQTPAARRPPNILPSLLEGLRLVAHNATEVSAR